MGTASSKAQAPDPKERIKSQVAKWRTTLNHAIWMTERSSLHNQCGRLLIEISLYSLVEDRFENLICSQRVLCGSRTPDRLRGCSRVAKLTWAGSILGWN